VTEDVPVAARRDYRMPCLRAAIEANDNPGPFRTQVVRDETLALVPEVRPDDDARAHYSDRPSSGGVARRGRLFTAS
jgi:hypothetical protein